MSLSTTLPVGEHLAHLAVVKVSRGLVELLPAHAHVPRPALVLAQVVHELPLPLELGVAEVAGVDHVLVEDLNVGVEGRAVEERLGAVRAREQPELRVCVDVQAVSLHLRERFGANGADVSGPTGSVGDVALGLVLQELLS